MLFSSRVVIFDICYLLFVKQQFPAVLFRILDISLKPLVLLPEEVEHVLTC